MALQRFISRRGCPYEIICDQGTNFKGGNTQLQQSFSKVAPDLQQQLQDQHLILCFHPPSAPHFGGTWEREIRSVKDTLHVVLGSQSVPEPVLHSVLVEVEEILNSKPLGYISSNVADLILSPQI